MGSQRAGEDIIQMLYSAKPVGVAFSVSDQSPLSLGSQPTRNTVEHLARLERMWEEFLHGRDLLTAVIPVRVRIFVP